ncbi:MAG: CDP-glucose 4,6-dehydratase [Chthoniobacterales bacterium]|nr:CDP-glucose 4,6-dehydratase [Chthoniobacterales bacterium]
MATFLFSNTYAGKKVFLTGHTGFKGSWLAEWLLQLGAEVHGYALAPKKTEPLFNQLGLSSRLHHQVADLRDKDTLEESLLSFQPDFVFHLAAQPLVRYSYLEPVETYETNVMGTIYLLEALRKYQSQRPPKEEPLPAVFVTTDKCYHNNGTGIPFSEEHALGGKDPYSSSKAMSEFAVAAYHHSYFASGSQIRLASARAGNVIGGGDKGVDRIVPDSIRALEKGESIAVRHPNSTRPWQHVLEPLSGYLWLGASLQKRPELATAFNFGPNPQEHYRVFDLVEELLKHWPGRWHDASDPTALHEATCLHLSIDKAASLLVWRPIWSFKETVAQTIKWYRSYHEQPTMALKVTQQQIAAYVAEAYEKGLAWAN